MTIDRYNVSTPCNLLNRLISKKTTLLPPHEDGEAVVSASIGNYTRRNLKNLRFLKS